MSGGGDAGRGRVGLDGAARRAVEPTQGVRCSFSVPPLPHLRLSAKSSIRTLCDR